MFLIKGRTDTREEKLRDSPLVPLLLLKDGIMDSPLVPLLLLKDGIVRREETLRDLMFQRY